MIPKNNLPFLIVLLTTITACSTSVKKQRSIVPIKTVNDVLTNIAPSLQTFEIDADKEILLKGEEGTAIYIPAGAFQFEDSSMPKGKITITLKECYSLSSMIAEKLSTNSYGKLLETGGMINIRATAGGKELQVKDGSGVVVGFPKQMQQDSMELFYGYPYADSGRNTWIPELEIFTQGEGFGYPGELPDYLYNYKLTYAFWNGQPFDSLKLKGSNNSIIDFLEDTLNTTESLRKQFVIKKWVASYKFSINDNGERYDYKKGNFLKESKPNDTARNVLLNLLKTAPSFDMASIAGNYVRDCEIGIKGSYRIFNYDAFKIWYRKKMDAIKDKAMIKGDKELFGLYMFTITRMGWINCDKFWNTNDEKIDFYVSTENAANTKVQIVFSDINSIMEGSLTNGKFVFNNLPVNKKIKVIGISYKDGKPTMSTLLTGVSKNEAVLTGYKDFTLDELEANLNEKN